MQSLRTVKVGTFGNILSLFCYLGHLEIILKPKKQNAIKKEKPEGLLIQKVCLLTMKSTDIHFCLVLLNVTGRWDNTALQLHHQGPQRQGSWLNRAPSPICKVIQMSITVRMLSNVLHLNREISLSRK